jgi:hypothetical protein
MNNRVVQGGISKVALGVLAARLMAALPHELVRADTFEPGEFVSYNTIPLGSRLGDTPSGPAGVSLEQNFDSVFAVSAYGPGGPTGDHPKSNHLSRAAAGAKRNVRPSGTECAEEANDRLEVARRKRRK